MKRSYLVVMVAVFVLAGVVRVASSQEVKAPAFTIAHHGAPEAKGEAVLRNLDDHHVIVAVGGPNGGLYQVEIEAALDTPIHERSKQCEVYHRSGESLIVALQDQGKVFIFALKGAVGSGSGLVPSGARTLAVTVVGDAVSLGFHYGTPLNLDEVEAGGVPLGLEALTAAEGRANPQNQYNGPGSAGGPCKASCSATRPNAIKIIGSDTCSVDCTPPLNCAWCSQDNAGVSCICTTPVPQ